MVAKKKAPKLKSKRRVSAEKAKELLARILLWKRIKWPAIVAIAIIVTFFLLFASYSIIYAKTSYRNIYIGDTSLGGKKKDEIAAILKEKSNEFLKSDIILKYQPSEGESKTYTLKSSDAGIVYGLDKTTDEVYAVGRSGKVLRSFYQQLKTMFVPYKVDAAYMVNDEALTKKIADIASEVDLPEKDFSLKYSGNGVFELSTEKQEGKRIDQQKLIDNVKFLISNVKNSEIVFKSERFVPQITEENAQKTLSDANRILAAGELNLTFAEKNFTLDTDTIAGLLGSRPKKSGLEIYLLGERVSKQVDAIASVIDRPAGDAVLSIVNGAVVVSGESQDGRQLDRAQTKIDIENAILARISPESSAVGPKQISLKVTIAKPEIDSAKIQTYGLKELVGSGTTSFAKSPSNRIHNINVGVKTISGALVKPGETFSTLKRLGKVDASTGYLPELVIKENKTVPEYGGGLCQVSTTLFRAALNTGVKITKRQNHKYRVSYYEPPVGMDATIYDPAPDFQFINNFGSYIFIQGRVSGTKITFEFYGTKDGRSIEIGTPEMFDQVDPGPPIAIPDASLAPGERKLLEKAHQGASAKFHYKIARAGQVLQEIDFLSKYVPWPEKWLVGLAAPVDPNAGTTPVDPNATPQPSG